MKTNLRNLVTSITAIAATVSITIALHPNPTEVQTNLANTTNAIAIGGATALFSLPDDEEDEKEE
ncbi:hypothetical protein [Spirulina sp. 06S082]|uniref:hypothetical protein n=1 Tax=Spirulina sp. 06S082 TaxID=3110248 RepID=UPI002B1EDEF6|nr:hypothetical protein [Spirulina sp. 06S082]MEA5469219.1 hypothetical protein [Spirulina sp. 06S082]